LESAEDEPFLRGLVVETVAAELGASAWPEPMRTHLLGLQYTSRRQSHRLNFPGADSQIIQFNGADVGWVVVNTSPDEVRLVEIMIVPELRSRGIGTAVIREILAAGGDAGKPVRLSVNPMNRAAIRLYERLGFRHTGADETQQFMEFHGYVARSAGTPII
jgi:ribosomal protein S18 acetylase RimI-like enzyme